MKRIACCCRGSMLISCLLLSLGCGISNEARAPERDSYRTAPELTEQSPLSHDKEAAQATIGTEQIDARKQPRSNLKPLRIPDGVAEKPQTWKGDSGRQAQEGVADEDLLFREFFVDLAGKQVCVLLDFALGVPGVRLGSAQGGFFTSVFWLFF